MAGTNYEVVEGDTLPSIAKKFGFRDWRKIWDAPENKNLREARSNPRVLKPGDAVFIPDKEIKEESRASDATHQFKAKSEKHWLRIILKDYDGKPLANEKYALDIGGEKSQGATRGDGLLEVELAPDTEDATLILKDRAHVLKIGHLDPVDTETGWQARLYNLGYFYGTVDTVVSPLAQAAVEEFQYLNGLKVDGIVGTATQAKLVDVHGC